MHDSNVGAVNLAGTAELVFPTNLANWSMGAKSFDLSLTYHTDITGRLTIPANTFAMQQFSTEICLSRGSDSTGEFGFVQDGVSFMTELNGATTALFRTYNSAGDLTINAQPNVGATTSPKTLAFTYDGTTARFYVNGTQSTSAAMALRATFNEGLVRIGSAYLYNSGSIYSIRVYNKALTAQNVADNAALDQRRFAYEWKNPYVTAGLIGLWDGEWNVAGGQHDGSATTWVDISGNNRDAVLSGTYSWGTNYWHVESITGSASDKGIATWPAQNLGDSQTVEFVIDLIASSTYGRIIAEAMYVASPIAFNNYPGALYMYGYGMDTAHDITDIIPGFDNREKHLHQIVHPSGGPMKYYIDGILCWTQNTSQDNTGGEYGYFANRSDLSRGIDADYFTMRRYNRVLTDAELSANYAIDKQRFGLS